MRKAITLLLALVMTASIAYAGFEPASNVPNLITYQGKLLTAAGLPLTNNAQSITFRIMDADEAGTEIWAETQPNVNVVNGLYTVVLGSVTALPADLTANPSLYLEVVIDGTALLPRTRIHSVPYALMAQTIDQNGADAGQYLQWQDAVEGDPGTPAGWYPATVVNTLQGAYDGGFLIRVPYVAIEESYGLPVVIDFETTEAATPTVLDVTGNASFTGDMTVTGTLDCTGDIGATNLIGGGSMITDLDPYNFLQKGATNGQVLAWNTANTRWQPLTIATDLQSAYANNYREESNILTLANATGDLEITGTTAGLIISAPLQISSSLQVTSTDPLYLPAAGKVLTSDATGFARWQAISSVVGWNYDADNDYLYTNMGRVGIGTATPTAKLEVRSNDPAANAVDIETSGDSYALRVASTGDAMNALDVIGNFSVAGYAIIENPTVNDIPALSVLTNDASAIYMQNNSFNYPALDVSNASPFTGLAVTGTAAGVPLVDFTNNGDGVTLKLSNDNPEGSALEVYGAKSSFAAEVLHNVTGTETAISVYSDAYAINMLTGNMKLSTQSVDASDATNLIPLVIEAANNGIDKFSTLILTGTPTVPVAPNDFYVVTLPVVTAEDAGRILVLVNHSSETAHVLNVTGDQIKSIDSGANVTFMCVDADTWVVISSGLDMDPNN